MLKSKFGKKLELIGTFIGSLFSKLGLSPNAWTLLTLVFAFAGFLAVYAKNLPVGLLLFFISGFIDLVDGAVARVTKKTSNFGAFLDGIVDRYVEFLLYMSLWIYLKDEQGLFFSNTFWIFTLMFGAVMTSFVKAYADHRKALKGKHLEEMGGLLERSERLDLTYFGMLLGILNPHYLVYMVVLVALLANLTALQRILFVCRRSGIF